MASFFKSDLVIDTLNTNSDVTVEGNLSVTGTTTTVSTTNTVISDKLIELANGTSGTPSGDSGLVIERGSSNNVFIGWDESEDKVTVGTGTFTGATTGDLSLTDAALKTGAITASGNVSTTGLALASGATVTAINDEDNMSSDSATALATQQSIKAYVDSQSGGGLTMANGSNNRIATATGAAGLNGEANLTFDGSTLNLINSSSDTNAGSFTSLDINFDKTGASTSDNTMIGLNVDMDNTSATNGTNEMIGAKLTPTLQHASAAGTTLVKGIEITATGSGPGNTTTRALDLTATGADFNQGVFMKIDDGGPDIKMLSSADTGDFCTIATGANGALTITTTDDDGANADINLVPDGEVVVTGTLQATAFRVGSDTLAEVIQDTVGAMVGSNTETGITVSYEDGDGTLDFVLDAVGTNAIADDAVTVAKIEDLARGQIIYGNASAETAKLSPGSNGTVLTSDGTDISWQASSGGGTAVDDLNLILHTQVFS